MVLLVEIYLCGMYFKCKYKDNQNYGFVQKYHCFLLSLQASLMCEKVLLVSWKHLVYKAKTTVRGNHGYGAD